MNTVSKLIFTILFVFLCPYYVYSQAMHALVVAATEDDRIGKGVVKNMQNMTKIIQDVANVLDCEFEFEQFGDSQCTKVDVTEWINNLDIEPDDVVFFFYSGHGGRALNDTDIFPQMCMNNPSNQALYMPVAHVENLIVKKNPRLVIIITECCNAESAGIRIKPLFAMSEEKYSSASDYDPKALRDLFFNAKGIVKISSSKPTEYSWICNTSDENGGGIFVNHFIDSFNDAVKYGKLAADWKTIFNSTHDKVYAEEIRVHGKLYRQEPISMITETKQQDKNINIVKRDKVGSLYETLQYLVDDKVSVDKRLGMINQVKKRHFTPDAKVVTLAANGITVIDYEDVDVFLKRIILSLYIENITVLNGSNDELNSLIKVQEMRK